MKEEDFSELKEAIDRLTKRVEMLERALIYTLTDELQEKLKPKFMPFFIKGHDMPIPKAGYIEPIRGRFVTLKVLYEENKPMLVEEICKKTKRSRSLETNYLNRLFEQGFVEKISEKNRIKYKITERGRAFIKCILH